MSDAETTKLQKPVVLPPGVEIVNGLEYMRNAKGGLDPISMVKDKAKLEDQLVRDLMAKAEAAAAVLAQLKVDMFSAVDAFNDLVWEKYEQKPRGEKGNQTLATYDGRMRILVQVADQIAFGEELKVAKDLVMECVHDWASTSRAELVAIVENAFRVDKAGQINRGALLSLLALNIADEKWLRGMDAIRDSIRVVGTKRYVRLAKRVKSEDEWQNVRLDLATA